MLQLELLWGPADRQPLGLLVKVAAANLLSLGWKPRPPSWRGSGACLIHPGAQGWGEEGRGGFSPTPLGPSPQLPPVPALSSAGSETIPSEERFEGHRKVKLKDDT